MSSVADKYRLLYERGYMMDDIKSYLLSVIAAAIISGLVVSLTGKKGMNAAVIKLLVGIFMAITVISPWTKLEIDSLTGYFSNAELESENVVADGKQMANETVSSIIKSRTEAYILDKAASLGIEIAADVTVAGTDPPIPDAVSLKGEASPYGKKRLQQVIAQDLGIPEEKQLWK